MAPAASIWFEIWVSRIRVKNFDFSRQISETFRKLEQENKHFSRKNRILRHFGPLLGAEDTNIFKEFFLGF